MSCDPETDHIASAVLSLGDRHAIIKPEHERRGLEHILCNAPNRDVWLYARKRYLELAEAIRC